MKRLALVGLLTAALTLSLPFSSTAADGNTECVGTLTGFIPGNVVVPPHQECFLLFAHVGGNVIVMTDAELTTFPGGNVRVDRDLIGQEARRFRLSDIHVGGNGNISGTGATRPGDFTGINWICLDSTFRHQLHVVASAPLIQWQIGQLAFCGGGNPMLTGGHLNLVDNDGPLFVGSNGIGRTMRVVGNTGGVVLDLNTIEDNLFCQDNTPDPVGGGNVVGGRAEGETCPLLAV